jgi:hypothetical protein
MDLTVTINLVGRTVVIHDRTRPLTLREGGVAYRLVDTGDGRIRVYAEIDVELLRCQGSFFVVLAPPSSAPTPQQPSGSRQ